MKVLMFGQTGQVATEVLRRHPETQALGKEDADLMDPGACAAQIAAADVDVIVNAAAYTAVDQAEEEPDLAYTINADAPGAMAQAAAARGIPFLHISTDYVFDGSASRPWEEDDPTAPLGAYGRSKLAGEEAVRQAGGPHVILRTAWVHAAHGKNFVRTMLKVGATREQLTVVDDQIGGPTAAGDIAGALLQIAQAFIAGRGVSGTYHYCGQPIVSWCGFARAIFETARMTTQVTAIPSSDWPTPAPRPANSALNCAKIGRDYGIVQPDWRISLTQIVKELETAP
ncbi:MAG: dTDP-4-dehydrorhamnose reductase [Pseudomonadota bacterium]